MHGAAVGLPNVVGFGFVGTTVYALTGFGLVINDGQMWNELAGGRGLPVGLRANALLRSGARLLLGTSGGVYALADAGQSWVANNAGLTAASVVVLAVSGNTILASAGASGLFRSNDDGRTWTPVIGVDNGNGRPFQITSLVTRGTDIYAGSNLTGGIFRSNDGGVNWTQINGGFRSTTPSITDLTVSGEDVYGLSSGFVYKLNAEGNGWTELTPSALNASRLAASGTNVYAAATTILLRSTDGGRNFVPLDVGEQLLSITALAARGNNVYLSALTTTGLPLIFISNDSGNSFMPSRSFASLTSFAFTSNALYATGLGGVYFSGNNGAYWTPVNAGLVNRTVNRLAVKGEMLLAGTNGYGVYAATNPRPGALAQVSAASFRADGGLAGNSIVAAFGANLATASQAGGAPLPSSLAGTQVILSDGRGQDYLARLFFVSPGQINYEMRDFPDGTELLVTVISGDGNSSVGSVTIARVAPGLFAANANGQGVAAAVVVRVKADGTQSIEPVAQFDAAQQRFVAVPIDLGPETDQVFLALFGTGLRFRSSLSAVTARIGGTDAQVTFAGPQPQFVGVDQVNVRLPRSLIGRGDVDVLLTVDGKPANTVRVNLK